MFLSIEAERAHARKSLRACSRCGSTRRHQTLQPRISHKEVLLRARRELRTYHQNRGSSYNLRQQERRDRGCKRLCTERVGVGSSLSQRGYGLRTGSSAAWEWGADWRPQGQLGKPPLQILGALCCASPARWSRNRGLRGQSRTPSD